MGTTKKVEKKCIYFQNSPFLVNLDSHYFSTKFIYFNIYMCHRIEEDTTNSLSIVMFVSLSFISRLKIYPIGVYFISKNLLSRDKESKLIFDF